MIKNKALVFDLGDVIIDLKPETQWWQEDLLPNFQQQELLTIFNQNFFHNFEKGLVSVDEFLNTMNTIKTNDNITVENAWCSILKNIPKHRIELLRKLSANNTIYLLSNTNHIHIKHIHSYILENYNNNVFDSIFNIQFYSQEIGMRKPDAEIYHYVQSYIDKPPKDIYFFDDKKENLNVPAQLGWNTQLVNQDIQNIIEKIM